MTRDEWTQARLTCGLSLAIESLRPFTAYPEVSKVVANLREMHKKEMNKIRAGFPQRVDVSTDPRDKPQLQDRANLGRLGPLAYK